MSMTIELGEVVAALNRLVDPNLAGWYAAVGEYEVREIQKRIRETKIDPEGDHWEPWRPATEAKRNRKGNADQGLLWDRGDLLNSVQWGLTGAGLEIGTDSLHGPFLQHGTRHMVAREYVGWTSADQEYLGTSLIAHLQAL